MKINIKHLIFLFIILFCNESIALENIGVLKSLEKKDIIMKHNIIEVLESFNKNSVIIDYVNIVSWDKVQNLPSDSIDEMVYVELRKFLRKNHIKKIVIGGDNFNYNVPPYHPKPYARKFVTKAIARLEKEGRVKVLGICGGLQGIVHFNDIKLDTVEHMIGKFKAANYMSAYPFISSEHYSYVAKEFYSCQSTLNNIYISQNSRIGRLMMEAEKKYNVKYERNSKDDLIVGIPMAHNNAISSFDRDNLNRLKNSDFEVVGLSEDGIVYVVENKKNGDIMIQGHPELVANVIRCNESFPYRDVIFSRLLFLNLLKNQSKIALPINIETFHG